MSASISSGSSLLAVARARRAGFAVISRCRAASNTTNLPSRQAASRPFPASRHVEVRASTSYSRPFTSNQQSTSVDRSGETTPSPKQQPADTPPEPRIAGPSTTAGQAEIAPGKNASSIAEQDAAMFRALHDRDGGGLGNETVDGEFEAGMKKFTRANQFRVI